MIKHITFKQFKQSEIKHKDGTKTLYYGRLYGNRDWGFVIKGAFDIKLKDETNDYIQAMFLTADTVYYPNGQVMPSNEKILTLKGITLKNFNKAKNWIEEHRQNLFKSVNEITNGYNTLLDVFTSNAEVEEIPQELRS